MLVIFFEKSLIDHRTSRCNFLFSCYFDPSSLNKNRKKKKLLHRMHLNLIVLCICISRACISSIFLACKNEERTNPGRISLSLLREYWVYVTAVMHRVAHAVIACASRDSLDRAYRFISRFFIAPTTRLTRLVYDSDADAAAR